MITIGLLTDYPDTIPALAKWFRDQWPDYYANWSQAEMEQDFLEDASRDRHLIRLLPFESNELAGTIVLREHGRVALPRHRNIRASDFGFCHFVDGSAPVVRLYECALDINSCNDSIDTPVLQR